MSPSESRSEDGDLQRGGSLDLPVGVAPQNGRAPFGRNDAVDRELLHQHAIADRDAECAAAAALAADDDHDGDLEHHHLAQVERDGFGHAALFRFDAGIRRGRIDEDDDRAREFLRQQHDSQRLAVAFGPRVAEVPEDLLLRVATLLVSDNRDGLSLVVGRAADDGVVIGKAPIAVQLVEPGEEALDVVERVRPGRMPRDEHALPGRQVGVDLGADLFGARAERVDRPLALRRPRQHAEGLDLLQQHANRFFEFK